MTSRALDLEQSTAMTYTQKSETRPVTVIETAAFSRDVVRIWSEVERSDFTDFIARNPEAGDVIAKTGGFRKIRWAIQGRANEAGLA